MSMLNAYIQGLAIGFSLIIAIGAQNAFVLKQGLRQQHIFAICLCCALSDAVLILAGVLGFSQLILLYPALAGHCQVFGCDVLVDLWCTTFLSDLEK